MKCPGYDDAVRQETGKVEQWFATPEEQIVIQDLDAERRWALDWGSTQRQAAPSDELVPLMNEPKRQRHRCDLDNSQGDVVDEIQDADSQLHAPLPSEHILEIQLADCDQGFDMPPEEENEDFLDDEGASGTVGEGCAE